MTIELRPLAPSDAEAQCAGEDDLTVRWLTGGYGEVEGTRDYIEGLVRNAEAGVGKHAFGMWLEGRMCGYIDFNPDLDDGIESDDVNLSYGVHPWARGRGVAAEAVGLVCDYLRRENIGSRAAIMVEPENVRSVRVAEKAGFAYVHDFKSARNNHPDGSPVTFSLYLLDL